MFIRIGKKEAILDASLIPAHIWSCLMMNPLPPWAVINKVLQMCRLSLFSFNLPEWQWHELRASRISFLHTRMTIDFGKRFLSDDLTASSFLLIDVTKIFPSGSGKIKYFHCIH